jgi:Flp pilus assembly pilin Flp
MSKNLTLKTATKAQLAISNWRNTVVSRMQKRADEGASVVEYAGLVVVIALIVVAVRELDLDDTISEAISDAVEDITGG